MIVEESGCVDCALTCIYEGCPFYKVSVHRCKCGEQADIEIDGEDFCYDCAEKAVDKEIAALPFSEKCILLGIEVKDLL